MRAELTLIAVIGVALIVFGVLFRIGRLPSDRRLRARFYEDTRRNEVLTAGFLSLRGCAASIPFGLGLLALVAAAPALAGEADLPPIVHSVLIGIALIGTALLLLSVLALHIRPGWLQPAWLRHEDDLRRGGLPGELPARVDLEPPRIGRTGAALILGFAAAAMVGVVSFGLPPALLYAAGLGLAILGASRLRKH